MTPGLKMRRDQLLIRLAPPPEVSSGGILTVAEEMALPPIKGRVLHAGPACVEVKVGDVVLVDNEALAHDLGEPLFRTPHLIVAESGLLAVLERA